jgi:hypothetical protein
MMTRILAVLGVCGAIIFAIWMATRYANDEPTIEGQRAWGNTVTVGSEEFKEATRYAIDLWNDAAGCQVLLWTDHEAQVSVRSNDGTVCGLLGSLPPDAAGAAYMCGARAEVQLVHVRDIREQMAIVAHELGHVLGHDGHDRAPCSIMHGNATTVVACSRIYITARDGDAAAERYCSQVVKF